MYLNRPVFRFLTKTTTKNLKRKRGNPQMLVRRLHPVFNAVSHAVFCWGKPETPPPPPTTTTTTYFLIQIFYLGIRISVIIYPFSKTPVFAREGV
jgi:hypothetical protein